MVRKRPGLVRLKSGPGFDMAARIEASRKAKEKRSQEVFAEMQKKYLGTFDTDLPCNCGKATIKDHATDHDPEVRRVGYSQRDFIIGPGPVRDPLDKITGFQTFHSYWCESCGALYKASVIEGIRRGYIPPIRRTAQKRWIRAKVIEINAL